MKIATWNVERLRHKKQLDQIQGLCDGIHADILVLTETDKPISEIAFDCGFTSFSTFNRAFRLSTGMTPREMRKRGKRRKSRLALHQLSRCSAASNL